MRTVGVLSKANRMAIASAALVSRPCDEGSLVFDEASGQTSLLTLQGTRVLLALSGGRYVEEEDLRAASGMADGSDGAEFEALLASLQCAGLVVR